MGTNTETAVVRFAWNFLSPLQFHCWTGKSDFRLTSNISAAEQATAEKIAVQKFTIEFYAWLISSSATVRRSAARGPKSKTFTPKFPENGPADRRHFCTVDRAHRADEDPGMLVSCLLWYGGGAPIKIIFLYLKNCSIDPPILFHRSKPMPIWWKTVLKNWGVLIDVLTFWGLKHFRGAFSPIFGAHPPNF